MGTQPKGLRLGEMARHGWIAFDEYLIEGGVIRPAPGATVRETSPWWAYEARLASRGKLKRDDKPPHESLLGIGREVSALSDDGEAWAKIEVKLKGRTLGWVARHGVLGLLLHDLRRIVRQDATGTQREWYREGALFTSHSPATRPPMVELSPSPLWSGSDDAILEGYFDAPIGGMPDLFSEHFWQTYGEPLGRFLSVARHLAWAFDTLRRFQGKPPPSESGDYQRWLFAAHSLNEMLNRSNELLMVTDGGEYRRKQCHASLLGSVARMAMLDLTGSADLVPCQRDDCFDLFVRKKTNQRFCCSTCQTTHQRRNQRAREREGRSS